MARLFGAPGSSPRAVIFPFSQMNAPCYRNGLDRHRWTTGGELRLAIVIWIERTCHRRRRQRALSKLTPIEFEAIHEVAHAA